MISIGDELERGLHLWAQIRAADADDIEPNALRSMMMVYGGAQGIWVDKRQTEMLSTDGHGVTVSILHTGRHYPDDLSDDGVIYHYPTTRRPSGRDAAEVRATKNAADLSLPIFWKPIRYGDPRTKAPA
jgi:putative restriction endonuclease